MRMCYLYPPIGEEHKQKWKEGVERRDVKDVNSTVSVSLNKVVQIFYYYYSLAFTEHISLWKTSHFFFFSFFFFSFLLHTLAGMAKSTQQERFESSDSEAWRKAAEFWGIAWWVALGTTVRRRTVGYILKTWGDQMKVERAAFILTLIISGITEFLS